MVLIDKVFGGGRTKEIIWVWMKVEREPSRLVAISQVLVRYTHLSAVVLVCYQLRPKCMVHPPHKAAFYIL